jgi:acyl-CoA reductase-like NAD-dependent aldehyde dehydrogenase
VQEGIYDEFLKKFTEVTQGLTAAAGDPFAPTTLHGPQVSKVQFDVSGDSAFGVILTSLLFSCSG